MKVKKIEETIAIPDGVETRLEGSTIIVKGPKGESKRSFLCPTVKTSIADKQVVFKADPATKREKKLIGTFKAHLKNMIKGVNESHTYKMKICSGHFPMKVNVKGNEFVVENFLGEKIPRILKIVEGVTVKVEGNDIIIDSVDKELSGQCAASIEILTKIKGRDKRIFQDGIYITEKSGKEIK